MAGLQTQPPGDVGEQFRLVLRAEINSQLRSPQGHGCFVRKGIAASLTQSFSVVSIMSAPAPTAAWLSASTSLAVYAM